ncbi:MAG: AraC family transcriptional regulator [Treponema sp.]|jgi:AraC-like DNA-binding protein|nr:AraC family transcriptional regulator [Treponema sp.]
MIRKVASIFSHRFNNNRFLNGVASRNKEYQIFFFPRALSGTFSLNGGWTDIVGNRIFFLSPGVEFSAICEDTSVDYFHIGFESSDDYIGPLCYFSIIPRELKNEFMKINMSLATACINGNRERVYADLMGILERLDGLIKKNCVIFAARIVGRFRRNILRHYHEYDFQIDYFSEGSGSIYLENRYIEYSGGCFCFIPPRISHAITYYESGAVDNYTLKFKFADDPRNIIPREPFAAEVPPGKRPAVLRVLKKIVGEFVQDIPVSSEVLNHLVEIINNIKNGVMPADNQKENLVNQVKQIVNANISGELRVSEIACQLGLSHEYLSRLFRKYAGTTIASYINEQRLKSSLVMLRNTNIPLKQIAAECGFKNINYFYTIFRKYYSATPRDVRRLGYDHLSVKIDRKKQD